MPSCCRIASSTAATSVLTLAGVDAEPMRSREHILLSTLFTESWRAGRDLDLPALIAQMQTPPIAKVGVLDLESFFPSKDRFALAMQLNQLLAAPGFAAWLEGEPLDIDRLLYATNGKPRVSVISIAHLDDHERMFFVSLLLNELVGWMRSQRGTSSLRALVYFDEIFGFLPPVANPPSKAPLLTLLKQARAFGLGHGGGDAESRSTWITRRSRTPARGCSAGCRPSATRRACSTGSKAPPAGRSRASIARESIACSRRSGSGSSCCTTCTRRSRSSSRRDGRCRICAVRWAATRSRRAVVRCQRCQAFQRFQRSGSHGTTRFAVPRRSAPGTAPVLDPAIQQFFVPGATAYVPMLLGVARVTYSDAKLGLDETRDGHRRDADHRWRRWRSTGSSAELADFTVDDLLEGRRRPARRSPTCRRPPPSRRTTRPGRRTSRSGSRSRSRSSCSRARARRWCRRRMNPSATSASACRARRAKRATRALAKVREKYASKLTTLQDRIRRAEQAVQVQSEQATGAKMGAAVSIGATIFGALLGRKAVSAEHARPGHHGGARHGPHRQGSAGRDARDRERHRAQGAAERARDRRCRTTCRRSPPTGICRTSRSSASSSSQSAAACRCNWSRWSGSLTVTMIPGRCHVEVAPRRRRRIRSSRPRRRRACRAGPDRQRRQSRASQLRPLGDQDVPGAAVRRGRRRRAISG